MRLLFKTFPCILSMAARKSSCGGSEKSVVTIRRRREESSEGMIRDKKIKISLIKGELSRQRVDVIVNSTNTNLDLKIGTISTSLLKVGGDTILHDIEQKYPDGIQVGKVARTTGGNLQCKEVYHGVMMKWDHGQGISKKVMTAFVLRCLKLADERGMASIAFPALGTGVLGFPADVVARLLFETIEEYDLSNPETGISSVSLVVYQEDKPAVQAFTFVEEKIRSGLAANRKLGIKERYSFASTYSMTSADVSKSHQFNIGPVVITIEQGDITKETTDLVVNSVLEDLKLSTEKTGFDISLETICMKCQILFIRKIKTNISKCRLLKTLPACCALGAVSKAILDAAGSSLQLECHKPDNLVRMKAKGFVITGSGNMSCGQILHTKARSKSSNWEETVLKCLKAAENKGANSVSFPALGTGGKGCNPDSVAKAMFSGFKQYIHSAEYNSVLKSIRIVIFQADMVKVFVAASQEDSKSSLKFLERFRPKQYASKVVFRIYAESAHKLIQAKKALDRILVEEKLFFRKQIVHDLGDRQVSKIKRMAQEKQLSVQITPYNGCIKLAGANFNVQEVKREITTYLKNIEKDADAKQTAQVAAAAARGSVSLPKSWGKMTLTDATKLVPLPKTDSDYIAVSAKFVAEAGGYGNIIKIERVQNPTLYTQYMAKKRQMEKDSQGRNVEQTLWHGTRGASGVVDNINNKGFDRNYNSGASHGVGVYFAVRAAMSVSGYCQPDVMGQKYIYLAKVLTGDYCVGQGATRLPPQKPSGIPTDRYDSTTDNVGAPNFFVIFHDAQAYPEFLITFR